MDDTQVIVGSSAEGVDTHPPQPIPVALSQILDAVALVLGFSRQELVSIRRKRRLCEGRQIYYWIARKYTSCTFPMIARHCGGRDHSTIMHGERKVELLYPEFEERINAVLEVLGLVPEVSR